MSFVLSYEKRAWQNYNEQIPEYQGNEWTWNRSLPRRGYAKTGAKNPQDTRTTNRLRYKGRINVTGVQRGGNKLLKAFDNTIEGTFWETGYVRQA